MYCNLETEVQALSQVKPFPSYFVTNESSKEPWRTEEHCLFVFERAFERYRGGRQGGKTLGEPPDRALRQRGGTLEHC